MKDSMRIFKGQKPRKDEQKMIPYRKREPAFCLCPQEQTISVNIHCIQLNFFMKKF